MTKRGKLTVVKLRPKAKAEPSKSTRAPKGHLMREPALALLLQWQFGSIITDSDLEKLLTECGRPKPPEIRRYDWLQRDRLHLNDFGRNIDLLLTLGIDGIEQTGFSLTPLRSTTGKSGGYELLTVWGDMLKRNRPREGALKAMKVASDHKTARPFCPADDPLAERYVRRMINKFTEIERDFREASILRVRLTDSENERTIAADHARRTKLPTGKG